MEKERKRGGALKGNRLETEKVNREGGKGNEEGGVRYLKRMDWKHGKGRFITIYIECFRYMS